jgi:hypothetical protein
MNTKSMLIAAGIGGVIMALLSIIPFVSCGNYACCVWVWGSAIVAVFIYRMFEKNQPGLTTGQGMVLGLAAGLVGAVLVTIWLLISNVIFAGSNAAAYEQAMQQVQQMYGTMPEGYDEMMKQFSSPGTSALVGAVCYFILLPLFGAIGGAIATGVIWKKPAA